MKKNNYKNILGIETSCDDTAIGIVTSEKSILSNIVINQNSNLNKYGGIVPEIAARDHLSNIDYAIQAALDKAKLELNDIDLITATGGPGLIGGVIVGTVFAKSLAMSLDRPYVAVNHLEGHALTARLTDNVKYPYLLLLVSGGHTQIIAVLEYGKYVRMSSTLDDAAGETFDKAAKILDIGFPGGPGLIGGVIVGTVFAKSLAMCLDRPYVAVNHLEGHALTARLTLSLIHIRRCRRRG